nr:circumsporozoite protein-like [Aegilops tauschii subsp. strangulata]
MTPTALVRSGNAEGDGGGDAAEGAGQGDSEAWAVVRASGRPACLPPAASAGAAASPGWSGSKFWALAEVSDGEILEAEDDAGAERRGGGVLPSVGQFVARAEELGGVMPSTASGRGAGVEGLCVAGGGGRSGGLVVVGGCFFPVCAGACAGVGGGARGGGGGARALA